MNQDKWAQAGWRIERKYANKVLLGNWAEERLQFSREPTAASSSSGADCRPRRDPEPDARERGSALLRAEGLPSKLLFAQSGASSPRRLMTHHGETYGRDLASTRPSLEPWRPDSLTWQREGSERPTSALPTDCGPPRPAKQQSHLPSPTVYRSAYQTHPLGASCQRRFARASRVLSSHLHTANHDNKDLDLRRRPLLQVPDWPPDDAAASRPTCRFTSSAQADAALWVTNLK